MLNYKKIILNLLLTSVFCYATVATAINKAYNQQDVYLADKPLPKIVAKLKKEEPEITDQEIITLLKNTLTKVTPEIAKEKFNIEWIDNGLSNIEIRAFKKRWERHFGKKYPLHEKRFYPAVVISYIDKNIGYALFALDKIDEGQLIAEYTGKTTNNVYTPFNPYLFGSSIDAQNSGNVARFTLSSLIIEIHEKNLKVFKFYNDDYAFNFVKNTIKQRGNFKNYSCFELFGKNTHQKYKDILSKYGENNIEIPNAGLYNSDEGNRVIEKKGGYLVNSGVGIKPFEQIVIYYDEAYWTEWFNYYNRKITPCLLHKDGTALCPDTFDNEDEL